MVISVAHMLYLETGLILHELLRVWRIGKLSLDAYFSETGAVNNSIPEHALILLTTIYHRKQHMSKKHMPMLHHSLPSTKVKFYPPFTD